MENLRRRVASEIERAATDPAQTEIVTLVAADIGEAFPLKEQEPDLRCEFIRACCLTAIRQAEWIQRMGFPVDWIRKRATSALQSTLAKPFATLALLATIAPDLPLDCL